ncbi:MAG: hypothetical protein IJP31_12270 [Lachnospiraceae bacterium]|nr:hypothetical protein [Lachnospiraceae bacterium]
MSAFLGPIHYWLYNKIQLQEDFTKALLQSDPALYQELDSLCGEAERRPLEEVIDTGNIHGWLQGQILIAESRFALGITRLLDKSTADLKTLKAIACDFGSGRPIQAASAPEVYKALQDLLLDGMPCDHVNQLEEQDDSHVTWRQAIDLHGSHWEKIGGNGAHYYELRTSLVSGMLKDSGFVFEKNGSVFTIKGQA